MEIESGQFYSLFVLSFGFIVRSSFLIFIYLIFVISEFIFCSSGIFELCAVASEIAEVFCGENRTARCS